MDKHLNNRIVPYYYGEFRDKVIDGKIPVNQWISKEMNRIDDLIANPNIYYDRRPIEGFIKFVESEMVLVDGGPVKMLDTFKIWAEQLLCWFYFEEKSVYQPNPDGYGGYYETKLVKKRLINKQFLIVSRSSAKSLYLSYIQNYELAINPETTDQITTAPTMKQAEEVITPIVTALARAKGPVMQFLTEGSLQNTTGSKKDRQKMASTKEGIKNFLTNSILRIRPMVINKLQGLRCKIATIDEWLSGDIREDVIGAIEQGASKIDDYIIIAASSEGTVRNGSGDEIKMELEDILNGKYNNPHVSIWYYRLDDIEEVDDPDMWMKAAPSIGITVSYETYQREIERMENVPASRNDILAKRFGIPVSGFTYFFTFEETKPHPTRREYWQLPCSMGVDLSQGDDFCSFGFLFPLPGDTLGYRNISFISEMTLLKLPPTMRQKYDRFIQEGSLIVKPGRVLELTNSKDGNSVYDDVMSYIDKREFDVVCVGYDPYGAKEFIQQWEQENTSYGIEKVIQGAKTESVPLGELKRYIQERALIFDQELVSFCMGNAVAEEDNGGNLKLSKKRYEFKIDAVSSLLDAYVAYKLHKEMF